MDKKEARTILKQRRRGLSEDYIRTASASICRQLLPRLEGAGTVMLYRALPGEVDLNALADMLLAAGVRVVLPKVDGPLLEVREYTGPESLRQGSFGIMEPTGAEYAGPIGCVVVPGLAFDQQGGRLGFGKGFYDRFLSALPAGTLKIGVCFREMLLELVPTEAHDIPMDMVLCE